MSTKLAIVGYGKMGKLIDRLAPEYGFEVALRLDSSSNTNAAAITATNFDGIDTAIEFSTPAAAPVNIAALAALGDKTATWLGTFVLATVVTIFGVALFSYFLQVPMPILMWRGDL